MPPSRGRFAIAAEDRPGLLSGFAAATAFLTAVPAKASAGGSLADAVWAFPLVGAGVGAVAAAVFLICQLVGLGDWPAALLTVLAGIALTRGLHEDGLADTVDGLVGGRDRETKLAIMRDSRVGTFGAMALVLSVGLRAAALAQIGQAVFAGLALIAAHAASRATLPAMMRVMAPARTDGLGVAAGRPSRLAAAAAALIGIIVALAALGPGRGAAGLALAAAAVCVAARLARRQIGGYTGDVLGAMQQAGEITMLLAAAVR